MSLEALLAENKAALTENTNTMRELIVAWNKLAAQAVNINKQVEAGEVAAITVAGDTKIPLTKKPVVDSTSQETVDASPASKPEASESATVKADPVTYDQVSKAITDGVKKNREHVVATLAKFGAKKGPELKPEQYPEFMAALES